MLVFPCPNLTADGGYQTAHKLIAIGQGSQEIPCRLIVELRLHYLPARRLCRPTFDHRFIQN